MPMGSGQNPNFPLGLPTPPLQGLVRLTTAWQGWNLGSALGRAGGVGVGPHLFLWCFTGVQWLVLKSFLFTRLPLSWSFS